jgi:hypothetical protein
MHVRGDFRGEGCILPSVKAYFLLPHLLYTEERLTINVGNVVVDIMTAVFQNTSSKAKNMPPSSERQIPFKFIFLPFVRI